MDFFLTFCVFAVVMALFSCVALKKVPSISNFRYTIRALRYLFDGPATISNLYDKVSLKLLPCAASLFLVSRVQGNLSSLLHRQISISWCPPRSSLRSSSTPHLLTFRCTRSPKRWLAGLPLISWSRLIWADAPAETHYARLRMEGQARRRRNRIRSGIEKSAHSALASSPAPFEKNCRGRA